MLEQQEYCGDIINFKSYSKSFRNKTSVENSKENWAIFKAVHEPIIDRETWERVQELTKNSKRRKPKNENVKKSIFTNLLYCGDCGHKLWFNINKQNPSNKEVNDDAGSHTRGASRTHRQDRGLSD